ncbi:MAG: CheR family methyltransferase, partial [Coleofasciculaceae cyanobacterium]
IAIILAEALGTEDLKTRARIYATDVDEQALTNGRLANYKSIAMKAVPAEYLDKYFKVTETGYSFDSELRQAVIFGKHNLVQDAPISRLDLLVCRNTLMYFSAETQARILKRFHFALKDTGFLFVGKAEMLLSQMNLFAPLQFESRIFSKLPKQRRNSFVQAQEVSHLLIAKEVEETAAENQLVELSILRDQALECLPFAQIIFNVYGSLVSANQQARELFGLVASDLGCLLQELEIPYLSELLSPIKQAYAQDSPIQLSNLELRAPSDNKIIYLDITIIPLLDRNARELGVSIVFNDVTQYKLLQHKSERSTQELKTLNEQLQVSNEELQTINEELQYTNEKLSDPKNLKG